MKITVQYSCFQDEHLIATNLEHIYDFADRIVISYGAFRGIRRIRALFGLPEEDDTRNIIRSCPDPEGKITLVEAPGGEWEDFTESRAAALSACGPSGFLMTQDTDEFWAVGALKKIRNLSSGMARGTTVAIDCPRIWLLKGIDWCLWPDIGLPFVLPYENIRKGNFLERSGVQPFLGAAKKKLANALDKLQLVRVKHWLKEWTKADDWVALNYANGVAHLPSPPKYIHKVVGFRLKPGLFWTKNQIDSRLIDPNTGVSWHRQHAAVYDPSIFCLHISHCDPHITQVKHTYYKTVFEGISVDQAFEEVSKQDDTLHRQAERGEVKGYTVRRLPSRLRDVLPGELLQYQEDA